MRFLLTFNADDHGPPSPEKLAALGKFTEEMVRSGVVLDTGGILPSSAGARVKLKAGKFTATDGPFAETKELILGYAIVQAKSREEAVELTRKFMMIAGDGEGEIRQLVGPGDGPHH
jgi:hypothetical protein